MTLTWLEICGFRSYAEPQRFDFDGVLTVVDGANSLGKTSTAEAIEFLLTGTTVRRQLLGGAKAEFAECLRNAHIGANAPVWVRAGIVGSDEVEHTVERVLEADYTAEDECRSQLTIDGAVVDDPSSIGIVLAGPAASRARPPSAQPPLRAVCPPAGSGGLLQGGARGSRPRGAV